jgi:hypothetical protein
MQKFRRTADENETPVAESTVYSTTLQLYGVPTYDFPSRVPSVVSAHAVSFILGLLADADVPSSQLMKYLQLIRQMLVSPDI